MRKNFKSNWYRTLLSLFLAISLCLYHTPAFAAEENLDEMFRRKERIASGNYTYNASLLEYAANHYIWQPETLMYHDVKTGHEVWRLSNTPNFSNRFHNDIVLNPWSADGKRLSWESEGRPTHAFNNYNSWSGNYWRIRMIMNSDGSYLRTPANSPRRDGDGYPLWWSPQLPDTYYQLGSTVGALFKVKTTDTEVLPQTLIENIPFGSGAAYLSIFSISSNGKKVMVVDRFPQGYPYPPGVSAQLFPTTIYPDSEAKIDVPNGYPYFRSPAMSRYENTPEFFPTAHASSYRISNPHGDWYSSMPSGSHVSWRFKTLGSAPDGGPMWKEANSDLSANANAGQNQVSLLDASNFKIGMEVFIDDGNTKPDRRIITGINGNTLTFDRNLEHGFSIEYKAFVVEVPNNNSEIIPVMGSEPDVFGTPYLSHAASDRWGHLTVFSNVEGSYNGDFAVGPGIWDLKNHKWVTFCFGYGAQHHDWHGWTDWTVSTSHTDEAKGLDWYYPKGRIQIQKYNDINSRKPICYTYTRYNSNGESGYYDSLPRPGQSPDGTKVAWHSTFFQPDDNNPDIFWTVAYYPYTPTNLSATDDNGVRLSWLPPKYTDRGWPDESKDPAPYAREIKSYHIWKATSQTGPWQEIGSVNAKYHVDNYYGLVPNLEELYYIDNTSDGTYYYTLTSEEHSKLESQELSEILEVTVSGTNVSSKIVAPKGQKNFWTQKPPAPPDFKYEPTTTSGHYLLTWTEPSDSKIRYYNIYYSTSGIPEPIQQNRIASVPVGTSKYLDWLADPNNPGYYRITSVDRYGNEGISPQQGLQGDVNSDSKVDIKDLILVAKDFGKTINFNPNCDINKDSKVDIRDLIMVAKNFGRTG